MKAEKTLSIKVKSKTERRIMENPEVEMITEWNTNRIVSAIVAALLIIIPAYYFSQNDVTDADKYAKSISMEHKSKIKKQDSVKDVVAEKIIAPVSVTSIQETIPESTPTDAPVVLVPPVKPSEQAVDEINTGVIAAKKVASQSQQPTSKQPSEVEYLSSHITQAQLSLGINKLKPYGKVDLPLLVDNTKATGIFFFTEVNDMLGSTVFHEWLKEGQSIFKLKAIIRRNSTSFYTSKLFTPRSVGQWQVRIITDQGEVLHKIDFSVENR